MYFNRTLTAEEELYASPAAQKIAELGGKILEESQRNDVTVDYVQQIIELEYTLKALSFDGQTWSRDNTKLVTDFYVLRSDLDMGTITPWTGLPTFPTLPGGVGQIWATVPQLNAVDQASIDRDNQIIADLTALILEKEVESIDRDNAIMALITPHATEEDITAERQLGGVPEDYFIPQGTTMDTVFKKLFGEPICTITDLQTNLPNTLAEVGVTYETTYFGMQQSVPGAINGVLKGIGDNPMVSTPFTAGQTLLVFDPALTWTPTDHGQIFGFDVTADNLSGLTQLIGESVYPTIYGVVTSVDDTPPEITSVELAEGSKVLLKTNEDFEVTVSSTSTQHGWVAIESEQSMTQPIGWATTAVINDIAIDNFILPAQSLEFLGRTYWVYVWAYRSQVTKIKFIK